MESKLYYEIPLQVRYYEADPMGVVHHSEYIRYFECCRDSWMDSVGYSIEQCAQDNIVFPVIDISCHYAKSARYGQTLKVTMELKELKSVYVVFHQTVLDPDGNLCAEGDVKVAFINTQLGRIVRCPEKLQKIIDSQLNNQ